MAISNIHETLLLYTKQKALINDKLSTNMMNTLSASKQTAEKQSKYNDKMNEIYYNYYEDDPETYELLTEQCNNEHELELANLNSWEQELEIEKIILKLNWTKSVHLNQAGLNCYKQISKTTFHTEVFHNRVRQLNKIFKKQSIGCFFGVL